MHSHSLLVTPAARAIRSWRALIICLLAAAGCNRAPVDIVLSGPTMGTTYTVKAAAPPQHVQASDVRAAIDEVLARVDREMSGYRADSEIERFNASDSTQWFAVSAELAHVVKIALEVSERSGGAFDVTVKPLVDAWGFGSGKEPDVVPDEVQLDALRARVGYRRLHARLDSPALRKEIPDLAVDLNGVAPGFAVDELAQRLQALGLENFMIDLGGEVRVRGRNARGELWRIAVERPADGEPAPYAIIVLDDAAVTTSGEYRHYYVRDGRRYSHTIDPRTARPVEHTLASVVVVGPQTAALDAWATAFNVLGAQRGYELALKMNMPAMFIEWRGEQLGRRMTPPFRAYLIEAGAALE